MIGNGNDGDAFMKYDQFNFILMLDLTIFLQAYMYEELVSLGNCSSRSIWYMTDILLYIYGLPRSERETDISS